MDNWKISLDFNPIFVWIIKCFLDMNESINFMKMETDISAIHAMLQELKEQTVGKVYKTKELSEYLKVGKAVIDKLRQDGELEFSKLGRTIVYTQQDVDKLLKKNHFSFPSNQWSGLILISVFFLTALPIVQYCITTGYSPNSLGLASVLIFNFPSITPQN